MPTSGAGVLLCDGRGLLRASGALAIYKQGAMPCCPDELTPVWTAGGLVQTPYLTQTWSQAASCGITRSWRDMAQHYYRYCAALPNETAGYVNAVLNGTPTGTAPLYPGYPGSPQIRRVFTGTFTRIPLGWYVGGGRTVGVGSVRCWHYREGLEPGVWQWGRDQWNGGMCCQSETAEPYSWWTSDPASVWTLSGMAEVHARHYIGSPGVKQVGENGLISAVTSLDGEWTTQSAITGAWNAQHPDVHIYASLPSVAASGWGEGVAMGWPNKTYYTVTNGPGGHIQVIYNPPGGTGDYCHWVDQYHRTRGYRPYPGYPAPQCVYWGTNQDQDMSRWVPLAVQPYGVF